MSFEAAFLNLFLQHQRCLLLRVNTEIRQENLQNKALYN